MLHLFAGDFQICIPQYTHSHILFSEHTRADGAEAAVLAAVLAHHHIPALSSHRPSAPDSAGTDCGYNEWGKSMPRAGSPW